MKKLIRGMDDIIYIASGACTFEDIERSWNAETGGGNITIMSYDNWADAIEEIEYAAGHITDFVEMSAEAELRDAVDARKLASLALRRCVDWRRSTAISASRARCSSNSKSAATGVAGWA